MKKLWTPTRGILRPKHTAHALGGISPAILGAAEFATPTAPPPEEGWPDPFMSYPLSDPIDLDGASNVVIENLSFQDIYRPSKPINLFNCSNITIRRIDTRRCTMGLVYAQNCSNIVIEHVRVENVAYEFIGQILNVDWGNENDGNVYQFNDVDPFTISDIKARYGNTEDAFSHFASSNGTVDRVHWEGATNTGMPTSDGSPSVPWTSDSGTGMILGDADGSNITVSDCTFIQPGQVGMAIASGTDCTFDNCITIQDGNPLAQPVNTAAYVWGQYATCSGHSVTNCRGYFTDGGGFWDGGNCGAIDLTGTDLEDTSLDIEDYRVVL